MTDSYLLVDVRNGLVDGYYFRQDDEPEPSYLEHLAVVRGAFARSVGHDEIVITKVVGPRGKNVN